MFLAQLNPLVAPSIKTEIVGHIRREWGLSEPNDGNFLLLVIVVIFYVNYRLSIELVEQLIIINMFIWCITIVRIVVTIVSCTGIHTHTLLALKVIA